MGLPASRTMVVSVITRLIRCGTSERTDAMIHLLNQSIKRQSSRLGIELDPRVFAYLCVHYPPARRRFAKIFEEIGGISPSDGQIYAILQHFLIYGCKDSCPECLDHPNRFNDFGRPSRLLAESWLNVKIPEISVESDDWVHLTMQNLRAYGQVQVLADTSRLARVAKILQGLLAEELEMDYLLLPISIAGIKRSGPEWKITLQVKETGNVK
jgi:hypothetical protein